MGLQGDAYVEEIKAKIDDYNVEINKFQAKVDKVRAAAQAPYLKHLEEIKAKRLALEGKIEELRHSGETAWEDVKKGVELAWKSLGKSIRTARSRFNS